MQEHSTPSESNCPYCGGEPEYNPEHVLSAVGYTHDDVHYVCSDCQESWKSGIPIGEYDGPLAEELFCDSCETRYGLPHRVQYEEEKPEVFTVHMKCPNTDCYHFWKFEREFDEHGVMLFGFPQITGSVEDAERSYGYNSE